MSSCMEHSSWVELLPEEDEGLSGLSTNLCMEHSSWVVLLPEEDEGALKSLYELMHRTQLMGGTPACGR